MLAKIIVPRLSLTSRYILQELEEKEREETFRLKRVKQKKIKEKEKEFADRIIEEDEESEKPAPKKVEVPKMAVPLKSEPPKEAKPPVKDAQIPPQEIQMPEPVFYETEPEILSIKAEFAELDKLTEETTEQLLPEALETVEKTEVEGIEQDVQQNLASSVEKDLKLDEQGSSKKDEKSSEEDTKASEKASTSNEKPDDPKDDPSKKDKGPGDGNPGGGNDMVVLQATEFIRISEAILPFAMLTLETMNEFDDLFDGEWDYLNNLPEIKMPDIDVNTTLALSTMPKLMNDKNNDKPLWRLSDDKTDSVQSQNRETPTELNKMSSNKVIVIENKIPLSEICNAELQAAEKTLQEIKDLLEKMKLDKERTKMLPILNTSKASHSIPKEILESSVNIRKEDENEDVRVIALSRSLEARSSQIIAISENINNVNIVDVPENVISKQIKEIESNIQNLISKNPTVKLNTQKSNNKIDLVDLYKSSSDNNKYFSPARSSYSIPKIKSIEETDENIVEEQESKMENGSGNEYKANVVKQDDSKFKTKIALTDKKFKLSEQRDKGNNVLDFVNKNSQNDITAEINTSDGMVNLHNESNKTIAESSGLIESSFTSTISVLTHIAEHDMTKSNVIYDIIEPIDKFMYKLCDPKQSVNDLTFADLDSENEKMTSTENDISLLSLKSSHQTQSDISSCSQNEKCSECQIRSLSNESKCTITPHSFNLYSSKRKDKSTDPFKIKSKCITKYSTNSNGQSVNEIKSITIVKKIHKYGEVNQSEKSIDTDNMAPEDLIFKTVSENETSSSSFDLLNNDRESTLPTNSKSKTKTKWFKFFDLNKKKS